jgi:hypothetical protein
MNIQINYSELAFIMKISVAQSKELFKQELGADKVTLKDTITSYKFHGKFGEIKSVDPRYDGADKYDFYLDQCAKSFRTYLNEKEFIKKKSFTGGKTIFYKILSKELLFIIQENMLHKHLIIYGKNKHDK